MGHPYGYGYGAEDLTPGTFLIGAEENLEVKTDSLMSSGRSLFGIMNNFFAPSMSMPLGLVKSDYAKDMGDRAIGNDPAFDETIRVADFVSGQQGAAALVEKLTQDLLFGGIALANVAMVMSEKYGGTDGFNACQNADAVEGAFNPPSNAPGGTLSTKWDEADDARRESNRQAYLPRVHPSDVKFWMMSGHTPGEDFVVEDTTPETGAIDPLHDGDASNGEDVTPTDKKDQADGGGDSNPYYHYDGENDYNPDREPYTPPNPEAEDDDTVTMAPGQGWTSGSGNHSTTVV